MSRRQARIKSMKATSGLVRRTASLLRGSTRCPRGAKSRSCRVSKCPRGPGHSRPKPPPERKWCGAKVCRHCGPGTSDARMVPQTSTGLAHRLLQQVQCRRLVNAPHSGTDPANAQYLCPLEAVVHFRGQDDRDDMLHDWVQHERENVKS